MSNFAYPETGAFSFVESCSWCASTARRLPVADEAVADAQEGRRCPVEVVYVLDRVHPARFGGAGCVGLGGGRPGNGCVSHDRAPVAALGSGRDQVIRWGDG